MNWCNKMFTVSLTHTKLCQYHVKNIAGKTNIIFGWNITNNYLPFLAKNLKDFPEFELRRHLTLDCWMMYHYKYFKNDHHQVSFDFFPLWGKSKEVRLYE